MDTNLPIEHICMGCEPGVRDRDGVRLSHGYCHYHGLEEMAREKMLSPLESLELTCRRSARAIASAPWRPALVAALLALTSGCATVVNGQYQTTVFESEPAGADCALRAPDGGLIAHFTTPSTLTVRRQRGYDLECSAAGRQTVRQALPVHQNDAEALNVLNGVVVGAFIDQLNNARWIGPSFWKAVLPRDNGGR